MKLSLVLVLLLLATSTATAAHPRTPQAITIDGIRYRLVRCDPPDRVDLRITLDRNGNGFTAFDLAGERRNKSFTIVVDIISLDVIFQTSVVGSTDSEK